MDVFNRPSTIELELDTAGSETARLCGEGLTTFN